MRPAPRVHDTAMQCVAVVSIASVRAPDFAVGWLLLELIGAVDIGEGARSEKRRESGKIQRKHRERIQPPGTSRPVAFDRERVGVRSASRGLGSVAG